MLEVAQQAYDRLAARFDYIVIEGAGSVAEMNLKHRDVVNTAMARYADARGLLVADIDRGGVFASLCGSLDLLEPWERALFRAFAVNRFRGDRMLFDDGVSFLEKRTGLACLGVFPMSPDIELDAEDGVNLEGTGSATSDIAVIRFPHVSNFTDFRLLPCQWISRPVDQTFRWVILPGTKNTMGDLDWLHQRGLAEWVLAQHRQGASILGVCGGYQMLGREIEDPYGVESHGPRSMNGLGLLPVRTVLEREKVTRCVAARTPGGRDFGAYEIHTGQTDRAGLAPFACLEDGTPEGVRDDRVCGTYLHGALESPAVVREWFGLDLRAATKDYDRLTDWFVSAITERVFEDLYL
jgi:adenosylcobyric acid synthase